MLSSTFLCYWSSGGGVVFLLTAKAGHPMTATDWKNQIYFGDNLDILRNHVADASVDLIHKVRGCPYDPRNLRLSTKGLNVVRTTPDMKKRPFVEQSEVGLGGSDTRWHA